MKKLTLAALALISPLAAHADSTVVDLEQELICLAENIYHEARGEWDRGQIAVAHVTLNRVDHPHWPDTICEVVYEPWQFSWTAYDVEDVMSDPVAWERAVYFAIDAFLGRSEDPTDGAVFYHTTWLDLPGWAQHETTEEYITIGEHVFYTWTGRWY
jgi:spore germination cell wall hydrolase CwlJ-like protein